MEQGPVSYNLTIANNEAITAEVNMGDFIGGQVYIPDSWTAANLGFKGSSASGGTFTVCKDKNGVPFQIGTINTTTGAWYQIPTEMFSHRFIKLWSKSTTAATETDANQTGAKVLIIELK